MIIHTKTWHKETHGLFDYESQNVLEQTLQTSMSVRIIRVHEGIKLIKDLGHKKNLPAEAKTLGYLIERDGIFIFSRDNGRAELNSQAHAIKDDFWLVVKSLKITQDENGYLLRKNDVLKLGRAQYRIRDMRASQNIILNPDIQYSQDFNKDCEENTKFLKTLPIQQMAENVDINCRICLHSENNENNILVSPCACSGSVRYVHIDCLKHWIKSKRGVKSNGVCTEYSWKSLKCELCHKLFPDVFVHPQRNIPLIDNEALPANSILIESLPKEGQSDKKIYLITVAPSSRVKLGRGHEVDVRINDISISRFHASLSQSNGNFYLHDNASKFGTLVLLKKNSEISLDQQPSIQIGRTLLSFVMKAKPNHISINPSLTESFETEKNLTMEEEEPQEFIDTGKKIEFSFEHRDKSVLARPNIFTKKPPSVSKSSLKQTAPVFETNMMELKAPIDSDILLQSHYKDTLKETEEPNPTPVTSTTEKPRKQRRTITKEMEDLGIFDDVDEEKNQNN